jgi:hypothetical protein
MSNQLIVLIIFGAIAFINYLIRQSASAPRRPGSGTRPSNPPPSRRPTQTGQPGDDERLRKFMEALGVPAQTPPPRTLAPQPPYVPRAQAPTRRQTAKPVVPRQLVVREFHTPPAPAQTAYQTETVGAQSVATGYEVSASPAAAAAVTSAGAPASSAATDLRSLLRSSSSIRVAMVLKEILGAPRGLQPMGDLPGLR